jgi:polysaccharide export outer membrane protein
MAVTRTSIVAFGLCSWLMFTSGASVLADDTLPGERPAYRIQSGDLLFVSVWKEEDLQKEILVRPDGGISFPLAGDMIAAGKSVQELQAELTEELSKLIPDLTVTVAVREILGNKIYVIGKVEEPGQFVVNPNVDVMQALSIAGGTTAFAALNDIRILRRVDSKQIALPFKYGEVEDGENLEQNIILQSGDTVVVP